MIETLQAAHAALGDVFELRLGPRTLTVVRDPGALERIFASNKQSYGKARAYGRSVSSSVTA